MSVVENMNNHATDIQAEIARMQELMVKSATGITMLEASQAMATSDEMMGLMELIGNPEIPEAERMTLAQYMGDMLKKDAANGLYQYANYMETVANDPVYAIRKDYYLSIANASKAVNDTEIYKDYIVAYNAFENDNTPEAQAARIATEEMQKKMKQWAEGN
ncbi:MAG: hypothetical protein K0R98_1305 [Rickettsiaceae bacterium]|jgi:hypothetical protein|nr:hypothetical protein [Rickettsiaceae bacterium]